MCYDPYEESLFQQEKLYIGAIANVDRFSGLFGKEKKQVWEGRRDNFRTFLTEEHYNAMDREELEDHLAEVKEYRDPNWEPVIELVEMTLKRKADNGDM